ELRMSDAFLISMTPLYPFGRKPEGGDGIGDQIALRTNAARPKSVVPTSSSFALSGTGGMCSASRVARSATGAAMTTEEVRVAVADARATVECEFTCADRAGVASIDHANPTGTTNAATSAANNNTRNRLRITRIFCNDVNSSPAALVRSTVSPAHGTRVQVM